MMRGSDEDKRCRKAIDIALEYGHYDGAHHKMWVIDQMLRALMGEAYENNIAVWEKMYTAEWDKGVAP